MNRFLVGICESFGNYFKCFENGFSATFTCVGEWFFRFTLLIRKPFCFQNIIILLQLLYLYFIYLVGQSQTNIGDLHISTNFHKNTDLILVNYLCSQIGVVNNFIWFNFPTQPPKLPFEAL